MKSWNSTAATACSHIATVALLCGALRCAAEPLAPLVDDFTDAAVNTLGIQRQYFDDSSTGGGTTTQQRVVDGVLVVDGELKPARGQPGWASTVLLLDPQGLPRDASGYEGVRLRIRVTQGTVSVSANSTRISNFDYHAALVKARVDGEFHEVRIPFAGMQRAWSEPTTLDASTINSLSIVAFGLQPGHFAFAVDEIGFYGAERVTVSPVIARGL